MRKGLIRLLARLSAMPRPPALAGRLIAWPEPVPQPQAEPVLVADRPIGGPQLTLLASSPISDRPIATPELQLVP